MQNLLERVFLFRVGEDYGAKLGALQVSLRGINVRAERPGDQRADFGIMVRQFTRGAIGIEESRRWKEFAEKLAERGLAGRDAAGNPDGGHYFLYVGTTGSSGGTM